MRKIYFLMTIVILLGGLPASASNNRPAKKAYRKGKRYVKRKDYIKSVPFLKEATNLDPENAWYNFLLGKSQFEGDRPAAALPYLVRAYNLDRSIHEDLDYYLARALHANEKFEDAIVHYESDMQRYEEGSSDYIDTQMRIEQCKNGPSVLEIKEFYKVENLGDFVNTEYPEYAATFAENYTYMIFTSRRPRSVAQQSKRRWHVRDINEEVYEARLVDGTWMKSRLFSRPIPKLMHDASVAITEDGQNMLYYLARNNGDIYISNNEDGKWSKRESIGSNINSKDFNEPHAFLTDAGETLVWVSDKDGGEGLKDIYISKRQDDGTWSEGVSIGDQINTPYDDDAPYVTPDGQFLYFSSRGHNSMGGYDLFRCSRQGDGWSAPENLGVPINSVGDDIYFVSELGTDGFYYSSDRPGGFGEKDIYHAYPYIPEETATIVAGKVMDRKTMAPVAAEVTLVDKGSGKVLGTAQTKEDGSYRFMLPECGKEYNLDVKVDAAVGDAIVETGEYNVVTGFVKDAISDKPLDAVVELIDPETEKVLATLGTNPKTGNYMLPVRSGQKYMVRVNSNEYLPYYEEFSVEPNGEVVAHSHEIGLQRKNEANKLVITWQFFDHDKDIIKKDYYKDLDHVVDVLNQVPQMKLNIIGHTDGDGSESYNQSLSEKRAAAVAEYLTEKGISKERLNVTGMGESMPIYDNSSAEFKKWNRRVELFIIN